ncbi:stage V sporulation protein K [Anaerosolibacter carboniphilus]|uniref:Stage V sporulation protein K n=1 Tax=Anaerosolibacter carboniphilus TaxID=1417629 RepID=A0A841KXH6_9FIRM|nr:AAA family ATPase [Anaerosolibacter carboniphilus]MBB6216700.1 stage V sporulation protein K [Anaerosolibacter carboniphilus]
MKLMNPYNEFNRILSRFESGKISTEDAIQKITVNSKANANEKNKEESLEALIKELDQMVGLEKIKIFVKEIYAYIEIQKKRKDEQLLTDSLVMHMIFKGNPGTGKTTVARLLGKIFLEMGVLEKGHLIEVERADLVGEYIGHTAVKVRDHIRKAMGGILFIDEAYSLARGGEKDFGKEAIDALVKGMEDYKENLVLILAGYHDEMEIFLKSNPGLKSRFPIHIDFPDYELDDLLRIGDLMVEKREYRLSMSAKAKLAKIVTKKRMEDRVLSGNARLVRNIIERAIRKQAVRLQKVSALSKDDLITIRSEDITDEDL